MTISKLPNELLADVIEKLDFADQKQCSVVNKQKSLTSLRFVFKRINMNSFDDQDEVYKFILNTPYLSSYVKKLHIFNFLEPP